MSRTFHAVSACMAVAAAVLCLAAAYLAACGAWEASLRFAVSGAVTLMFAAVIAWGESQGGTP